jgi:TATA-binding protein-associated factor
MSPLQHDLSRQFYSAPQGKRAVSILQKALETFETDATSSMDSDVLKSLLFLRLLATHPWLVCGEKQEISDNKVTTNRIYNIEASGKLMALRELLRDAGIHGSELTAADNDCSLLYCEDESNETVDEYQQSIDPGYEDSLYLEESEHNRRVGSRCLIFAQFMHSLDVVEDLLLKRYMPSVKYLRLDGKVPPSKRAEIVNKFNDDESIKILLLTTRIGGLGLNLTGADTVIFLEHDWNPMMDLQAMDRAHRIGQKKTVHVYQLVTMNSIEEKTMILHEKKLAMSAAIVNTDNSSLYSMGTDRLLDIFQVRSEVATSSSSSSPIHFEDTLDSLVERYEEEYHTLSVGDFIKSFRDR